MTKEKIEGKIIEGEEVNYVWHDGTKSSGCASSTNDQSFVMQCHAVSRDNYRFDWSVVPQRNY